MLYFLHQQQSDGGLMPVVFLDGDELDNRSKRLVLKAVGPITFKCKSCGGGFVDLKNIFVTSESTIVSY